MKLTALVTTLALAPCGAVAVVCNADNVLRALRSKGADAASFCSTYTLPPPDQPLPTYVSQYPASRVSSGCSCLVTTTSIIASTLTTSITTSASVTSPTVTPSPTNNPCNAGDLITNGGFGGYPDYSAAPWVLGPDANNGVAQIEMENGARYAKLFIYNQPPSTVGSTFIKQDIPSLCTGTEYQLTFTSSRIVIDANYPQNACNLTITLVDEQLALYNSRTKFTNGPYSTGPVFIIFVYSGSKLDGNTLAFNLNCKGSRIGATFQIDDISLKYFPRAT